VTKIVLACFNILKVISIYHNTPKGLNYKRSKGEGEGRRTGENGREMGKEKRGEGRGGREGDRSREEAEKGPEKCKA